jgi:hypothetical protein
LLGTVATLGGWSSGGGLDCERSEAGGASMSLGGAGGSVSMLLDKVSEGEQSRVSSRQEGKVHTDPFVRLRLTLFPRELW